MMKVSLEPKTWAEVQEAVRAHRGKVVLVDLWSTSCEPCIRELPHLSEIQRRYPEQVVCMTFNLDYIGIKTKPHTYYEEAVKEVLSRQESQVVNFQSTVAADEVFVDLDIDSIPVVYVYDAAGEVAQRFDNRTMGAGSSEDAAFSYKADIFPLVEKLVGQQTSTDGSPN